MNSTNQNSFTFKDYQDFTATTAKYPNVGNNLEYPILGLMGEFGELCEKFKKLQRDSGNVITEEIRAAIIKECGDVMWYVARIASECGLELESPPAELGFNLKSYFVCLTEGIHCISFIIENIRQNIEKHLIGRNLQALTIIISQLLNTDQLKVSLEEVLKTNMAKLQDRKDRNVIGGSGDNR